MDSRLLPLLGTVGSGCSVCTVFPSVLLLDSFSVASESPSGIFVVVVLASLTVDSRFPPLLATVGVDCPVGIGVLCVLLLEPLSVASTLPSLPGAVGSDC